MTFNNDNQIATSKIKLQKDNFGVGLTKDEKQFEPKHPSLGFSILSLATSQLKLMLSLYPPLISSLSSLTSFKKSLPPMEKSVSSHPKMISHKNYFIFSGVPGEKETEIGIKGSCLNVYPFHLKLPEHCK